jgi:hypothetical protein
MKDLVKLVFGLIILNGTLSAQEQKTSVLHAFDKASYYWSDVKPSMNASYVYRDIAEFNPVDSSNKMMKRKLFEGVHVMIDYTCLRNIDGQKAFKDVTVYYTDLCENCYLDVKFSTEQFLLDDIPESDSFILIGFSLTKRKSEGKPEKACVTATLSADGDFRIQKSDA